MWEVDIRLKTGEKQAMAKNFDPSIGVTTRWQKGCPSPNPAGRPRRTLLTDAFREILAQPFPGDSVELAARWRVPESWIRSRTRARTPAQEPCVKAWALRSLPVGIIPAFGMAGEPPAIEILP
jgi:hypothetical protein